MAQNFTPLNVAPAGATGEPNAPFRLKIVAHRETGPAFVPLASLQSAAAAAAGASNGLAGGSGGQPKITLEREGDRVTLIRIECACGQLIELACSY